MKFRGWGTALRSVLAKSDIQAQDWEEVTEQLLLADIGAHWTAQIVARLKQSATNKADLTKELANQLMLALQTTASRELDLSAKPAVIIMVGVNGVGKTTTIGKLAHQFKKSGKSVVLGAADTFRAAAVDQLIIWSERVGVPIVQQGMNADPASVAFDTLQSAKANNADVVIIDTAGRLHNKVNLMNELSKIKRVMEKVIPGAPHEILLVLDGSTGQNAFEQAKQFAQATDINALAVTKLDGTAKGGVVIGISDQMKIPVKYIGVGEKMDDLQLFDRKLFVESLFAD